MDYPIQRRSAAHGYGGIEIFSRKAVGVSTERGRCARVVAQDRAIKCPRKQTDTDEDADRGRSVVMIPTLQDALDRARVGDPRGFEEIYGQLAGAVTRFAHSRNADDPEGLTNEVFLAAFGHLDDFVGDEDDLRGWIFTIARNKLIDDARRRRRRPRNADDGNSDDQLANRSAPGVDDEVVGDDWVHDQLAILTDEQREVLLMRVVGGLSVPEIAEVTGRTAGSIKALQRRALRQLQKNLLPIPYPTHAGMR